MLCLKKITRIYVIIKMKIYIFDLYMCCKTYMRKP